MYQDCVANGLVDVSDQCEASVSCLYTSTPDSKFVIDFYPGNDRNLIASPCSGHGFKHSAAIGRSARSNYLTGKSDIDISSFSIKRYAA